MAYISVPNKQIQSLNSDNFMFPLVNDTRTIITRRPALKNEV